MSETKARNLLAGYSQDCQRCSECLATCSLLDELGMTPGEIAEAVCNDQVNPRLLAAIQRCDLCGRCSINCPENLNPAHMMKAAREVLMRGGRVAPEDYNVMLVDRDWNFFTIYRETYGIHYADLSIEHFDTLFFPGCTLGAYSPELTRAAFNWLKGRGDRLGFSDLCCGKPLDSIGLTDEADRYLDRLRAQLDSAGARRLVTACPNCEASLRQQLQGVEVLSLYALMVEEGMRASGSELLTTHDSCADRYGGTNPQDVRTLLGGYAQVEMSSHGENTICCGSGGIVSMIDPGHCSALAQRRLTEYAQSGAEVCITSCMACAHRLARAGKPGQVQHCLEKVLGIQVDYAQVERNTRAMWEGSQGELNQQRLSQQKEASMKE